MSKRVFATFNRAAEVLGKHPTTIRQRVAKGDLAAFRLPGRSEYFIDLAEARALFSRRRAYGSLGPDAKIVDLSAVVGADFTVVGE